MFVNIFFINLLFFHRSNFIKLDNNATKKYNSTMKSYQEMLKSIMKSSGWSQQQLAIKLGVSFPTVNYWLNNKVTPRPNMQKRIRNLYIARDIPYEGPVFITLKANDGSLNIGDEVIILKTSSEEPDNYELFGFKRKDIENAPLGKVKLPKNKMIQVVSDPGQIIKGTKPGFRIYDRIYPGAFARIMFIVKNLAIAVVEDFGIESYNS